MANINYQLLTAACDSCCLQGNYWSRSLFYFPVTCYLRLPKLKASVLADVKCCWWSTNVIISKTGSYVGEHAKCEWIPWRRKLMHSQGRTLNSSIFLFLDALRTEMIRLTTFLDSIELSRFSLKSESMFSCILHCLKNVDVLKIVRCLYVSWLISISVWPTKILWNTVKSTIFYFYRKVNNLNHISITRNRF